MWEIIKSNSKPKSYEEWSLSAGVNEEMGGKITLTHKLLRDSHRQMLEKVFDLSREAFIKSLFERGQHPVSITFVNEDDSAARLREVSALLTTYQGASLVDYAGVGYKQALDLYNEVQTWQNKSLWQYLKWWGKRTLRRVN